MKTHLPADAENGFSDNDQWKALEIACHYFYENRSFYSKVLSVQGQNSLSSHFREILHPIQRFRVDDVLGDEELPPMVYDFVVDGIDRAIELWILDKDCVPVEEFMYTLKKVSQVLLMTFNKRLDDHPQWLEEEEI